MQIEFQDKPVSCLQEQAVEVLYQEETAEVIVPDVYPDVQTVVDASAICCLRDQEILSGSITASGAFQAVVIFTAEETGEVCVQEAYLPFSAKLSREEIRADSFGCTEIRIRSVDARILNSRKLLIRVSYALRFSVYGQAELTVRTPAFEDPVQLLMSETVMTAPVSAAEKSATFTETITIPAMAAPLRRVAKVCPTLLTQEHKLVEGRAVWRGSLQLRMLCLLENGNLEDCEVQIPVSQYLDLPGGEGNLRFLSSLSEFQIEEDAQGTHLVTVGLRLQAMLHQTIRLPVVEDGYCIGREFRAEYDTIPIRQLLDEPSVTGVAEAQLRGTVQRIVDSTCWVDFPVCKRSPDEVTVSAVATMHLIYRNDHGQLCGELVRGEVSGSFALCDDAFCCADAEAIGGCYPASAGEGSGVACKIGITARCYGEQEVRSMRLAEVGEAMAADEERPSLIVRRCSGAERLWDVAKQCGATVRAIREANGIEGDEAEENSLLLIPMV